ncbi:hypothetical protein GCM10010348_76680 [Streptomyces anthocyanicus]|nr:hypothetical protein GCM10010348_76680 [Streptomyces anthocyanicus]
MCSVENCTREAKVRGWCKAHYLRWYRFGDPTASAPRKTPEQRYHEKVNQLGPDECWPWTGAYTNVDRGAFRWKGKIRIATRVGWEIAYGQPPGELHVCHTCDHGWCHNPRHWFLGTHADNMRDLKQKNLPRGRPLATTPEIDAQIDEGLKAGESHLGIARRLGIGRWIVDRHATGLRNITRAHPPNRIPPTRRAS